ncbi:MAG: hypothetical protein PHS73_04890 [Candidatus Peribacteraceae bacterium]|nr:hypothetical protein [Candidatus Peribacteraceae bacterium]
MRPTPLLLSFCLLASALPASLLAAETIPDLTPEEIQYQQWDTECRALLPYGQGDLEAALLFKLRQCINQKQDAKRIADQRAYELDRLSNRSVREAARRAEVQKRMRGSSIPLTQALSRRTGQGVPLLRTIRAFQRIHGRIQPDSATTTGN